MRKNNFLKQLKIGNEKEKYINELFNLIGIPSRLNNIDKVTDIDIELISDNIYMDVKYIHTPYFQSKNDFNIEVQNCIPIKVKHINKYFEKEIETNKRVWIVFYINFEEFGINELRFISNSELKIMVNNNLNYGDILNIDRNICKNFEEFYKYLLSKRELNKKIGNL